MNTNNKAEHLKALGFDFLIDIIVIVILILAYKYTYDTLDAKETTSKMNFIRNAFVFIAPASVETFKIITSESRKNKKWDVVELIISILIVLVALALMLQCIFVCNEHTSLYVFLIMLYPIRVTSSISFEFLNLIKERG